MTPKLPISRRTMFKGALAGAGAAALPLGRSEAAAPNGGACAAPSMPVKLRWGQGFEGQRKADLGDGTFLNPIVRGRPSRSDDPQGRQGLLHDLLDLRFLSGLIIWHSRDLVNWRPIGPALTRNIGSVWALDLGKHNGRYLHLHPDRSNRTSASTM